MSKVSDEQVEAAARAMCIQGGYDPDEIMANDGPRWKYYAPGARAALEAVSSIYEAEPVGWQHRGKRRGAAVFAEWLDGRNQSYDTAEGAEFEERRVYAHPAPISKGVTVKALEWVQFTARAGDLSAKSMVGEYVIRPGVVGGAHFRLWLPGQDYNAAQRFDTSEAAQSAAQADFDARVLSCLSHTAGEIEP